MIEVLQIRRSPVISLFHDGRLIVWFSCGAASACALKLVAHLSPLAVYCDTSKNEHEDNARFMADVERWTGVKVQTIKSEKFDTVEEVFDWKQYISGPAGAPCTVQMKKVPRFAFQRADDTHVFGYTTDEAKRVARFEADNFDLNLAWPLVQAGMNKQDCHAMIAEAGIESPAMYRLGYRNNNCKGCVKAQSPDYWNAIRRDFPDVFKSRCEQSRRIGARLVRLKGQRIFLDELPAGSVERIEEDLSCGPQCAQGEEPRS